jgi:hypothetical protein
MKLPGSIELSDEVINGNGHRVVHFKVQDLSLIHISEPTRHG